MCVARSCLPLLVLMSLVACKGPGPEKVAKKAEVVDNTPDPAPLVFLPPCASPTVEVTGRVSDATMSELSGLAASRRHPDVFWVHNDSGHKARVYAIDSTGKRRASWKLKKVPDTDWEDVAVGPCAADKPTSACIYLADTGDNRGDRVNLSILRWPEPKAMPQPGEDETLKVRGQVETIRFGLPNGPDDVEAMVVLPDARIVLFSKRNDGTSHVYRVTPGQPVAESLGSLRLGDDLSHKGEALRVTAADLHPNGTTLVLRTYGQLRVAEVGALLAGPVDAAQAGWAQVRWTMWPTPDEPHGEAAGWGPDGAVWSVSDGQLTSVSRVGCAPQKAP